MQGAVIENGVLRSYQGGGARVVIPEEVCEIGERVFARATSILEVVIRGNVKKINASAFLGCKTLRSAMMSDASVTELPAHCFADCISLERVSLPRGLRRIGEEAFEECESLRGVSLPSTLEEIGVRAFRSCTSLRAIALPEGLRSVGREAFNDCEALESLTVPRSLSHIGEWAFTKTPSLALPQMPKGWRRAAMLLQGHCFDPEMLFRLLLSDDEMMRSVRGALRRKSEEVLSVLAKNPDAALLARYLSVWERMPLHLLDRFTEELRVHTELHALLLEYKFQRYSAEELEQMDLASVERELRFGEWTHADWAQLFRMQVRGDEITLLEYLGKERVVEIPDRIGHRRVTDVGERLRKQAKGLGGFLVDEAHESFFVSGGCLCNRDGLLLCYAGEGEAPPSIPEGVREIGAYAFFASERLTELTVPSHVKTVGREAFAYCPHLTRVNVEGEKTEIREFAFARCATLRQIRLSGVRSVGVGAFRDCRCLALATLGEGLVSIEKQAFLGCQTLETVHFPKTLERISARAFEGCNLRALNLPESVREIGDCAFIDCKALERATLPETLTILGAGAFCRCEMMSEIRLARGLEVIHEGTFSSCSALKVLTLPASLARIEGRAFARCYRISSLTVPATVREIGEGFLRYSGVKELILEGCSIHLDADAFDGAEEELQEIRWSGTRAQWRRAYPAERGEVRGATVFCKDGEIVGPPPFPWDGCTEEIEEEGEE